MCCDTINSSFYCGANDLSKVIFLDIDGVLNSNFWNNSHSIEISEGRYVDEDKVLLLAELVKETGAIIIMHSGWRFWFDEELRPTRKEANYLADMFERVGLRIGGVTPDLTTEEIRRTKKFSKVKAEEILAWIGGHPDTDRWVVIDDLDLHNEVIERNQVLTDAELGLTENDVKKAIELLS